MAEKGSIDDLLSDFIAETREMLEASESELIAWEADPSDHTRLDAIFRFVHTLKGNCGFFDFPRLEKLSHRAEDALAEVRAGRRKPDSALVSAVLAIIDRIAEMVDAIESNEDFPEGGDDELIAALEGEAIEGPEPAAMPEETADGIAPHRSVSSAPRSIRLPVDLLDRVMSGVSDMVLARNDLGHRLRTAGAEPTIDGPFERLSSILGDVRDAVTRMRMQRIEYLFGAFPRLVRDLSGELGKQVMIDLQGGEVELDREMVEMIRDPLTHIIRNAIDHGIETPAKRLAAGKREIGLLTIAARQSGNRISILVSDDGRGLDEEQIARKAVDSGLIEQSRRDQMSSEEVHQLVFAPGFSTASEVSAVSGRGVGLDVVRENLEKIGGSIKLSSTPGKGTLFHLQIPLTLSIIPGLTLEVGGQGFAVPQSFVEEIIHLGTDRTSLDRLGESLVATYRGKRIACISLADVLGLEHREDQDARVLVVARLASGDVFALMADRIHNIGDLVVKPLPPMIMASGLYGGSTLLDDGHPMLVLDLPKIAASNGLVTSGTHFASKPAEAEHRQDETERAALDSVAMLFTGFDRCRRAVRLDLVERIETIESDAVDFSGSTPRAVVDGEVWPLVGLDQSQLEPGKLRLLRLSDGSVDLLYAVRRIEDSVELEGERARIDDDPLVEAVALYKGKPVSLIDAHALFARHAGKRRQAASKICLVPDSEWSRGVLAPLVEEAGYQVTLDARDDVDVTIVLDEDDAPETAGVVRLRSRPDDELEESDRAKSIYRYDRGALIEALIAARRGGAS